MKINKNPKVGVIMGSQSDWEVMKNTCDTLRFFNISFDVRIISAHRTPKRLEKFINDSKKNNFYQKNINNITHYDMKVEDNIINDIFKDLLKTSNFQNFLMDK